MQSIGQSSRRFHPQSERVRRAPRLLPLSLSVAICLPAMATDKPVNWGLCPISETLPGFETVPAATPQQASEDRTQQPTDIEGDKLTGTTTVPQYSGNVTLNRGDQYLHADNLRFDTATGNYVADGHVRYQDASIRLIADRAEGNQDTDTHKISNIKYQLVERRGNGVARSVDIQGAVGQMHRSTYTTCDPSQPVWLVRAPEIDVDNDEGFGTARYAVLQVGKIPVMWLPWFKFPIDDRRQTGLLYPEIGRSSRNGFDYTQPIYLNLAPNYDDTLYPRYMSARGVELGNEFRYIYDGGRGTINATFMPDDKLRNKDRGSFAYDGSHDVNSHWQVRSSLRWVSDTRYMEDFSSHLEGLSSASYIESTLGIYGTGDTWTAGLMADHWQLTDYTLDETSLAYDRMPRLYFTWDKPFSHWFEAGINTELVRFVHKDAYAVTEDATTGDWTRSSTVTTPYYGGSRLDIKPFISFPLSGAAWFITPTLAWRYTAYQLETGLANELGGKTNPTRSLPIASLDAGLYFDRETTLFGKSYLNTLEPRIYYLYVPYRNQSDLPLFDTRALTFSWSELFRDTRYSGADRQNDANQLTLAATSRWLRQSDGQEKLSLSAGQILYFEDSKVTAGSDDDPVEKGKSAWVADASYLINDRWNVGTTYQWNPNIRREDMATFHTRYLIGDDGIINLAYRYRRDTTDNSTLLKQVDLSFLYPINPTWSVVGRYYYSLLDKEPLEIIGGVQWDSCCLAVRAVVRHYISNREGDTDNAFQLEFVLKGLSSIGQNTDRTLRRAILGYYRDDLYLVPPSNTTTDPDDSGPDDSDSNEIP